MSTSGEFANSSGFSSSWRYSVERSVFLENEIVDQGKTIISDWKNGKRGAYQKLSTKTTLSDGSVRITSEDLEPPYIKPVRRTEGVQECLVKDLPGKEWLALAGDMEMGVEIEKLNARALLVYEADRALRLCGWRGRCPRFAALFAGCWLGGDSMFRGGVGWTAQAAGGCFVGLG